MKLLKTHWLCALITIGLLVLLATQGQKHQQPTNNYKELLQHLDSLNVQLDSLKRDRDSLIQAIDTSKARVDTINNWYEKELVNITNQPIASDVVFFTEYLSNANKGFADSNNSTTAKED